MNATHIVVFGGDTDLPDYIGPFDTAVDAVDYAERTARSSDVWEVLTVEPPDPELLRRPTEEELA